MTDKLCARPENQHLSWFPESPDLERKVARVIRICEQCPERWDCLIGAQERREQFGVWGGRNFTAPPRSRKKKAQPVDLTKPWPPVWNGTKASQLEGAA